MADIDLSKLTGVPVVMPVIQTIPAYTPASTQGFGTVSIAYMVMQRSGNRLQGIIRFGAGTVTASTAQFSLPNGCTIATLSGATAIVGEFTTNRGSFTTSTFKSGKLIGLVRIPANYRNIKLKKYAVSILKYSISILWTQSRDGS